MTEDLNENVSETEAKVDDVEAEMASLKERASVLGLRISPKIGLDTLRKKVNAAVAGEQDEDDDKNDVTGMTAQERKAYVRKKMQTEQMALVRLRISNLNPDKADLHGEVFTVANKYLGNVRKYVPYGEATDNGYHVPVFIHEQLKTRKFLQKKTKENSQNGNVTVQTRWVNEFALEVLPQLTEEELNQLANQQRAAMGLST